MRISEQTALRWARKWATRAGMLHSKLVVETNKQDALSVMRAERQRAVNAIRVALATPDFEFARDAERIISRIRGDA